MTMMTVIRSVDGNIINIGPWDYQYTQVPTGEVYIIGYDEEDDNSPIWAPVMEEVATNPLPEGAYEDEADIVVGWDGGLYEASDPRRLGPNP